MQHRNPPSNLANEFHIVLDHDEAALSFQAEQQLARALGLFATAMSAGFVLLTVTALGPLDLDEHSVLPLDVWWLASVWLTVRAIGTDDFGSRREWLGSLLAYQLVLAAPLGLYTVIEALDGSSDAAAALVGGVAAGGFWFGRRETLRRVMGAAAFCFVVAAWYWGVERGGALGAVFALVCAAGALFWISGRTGGSEP